MRRWAGLILTTTALALSAPLDAQNRTAVQVVSYAAITTTRHPPLPAHPSLYWLVPDASGVRGGGPAADAAAARLALGAARIAAGDFAAGLALVTGADLRASPLASYARYYAGVALLGLQRFSEAEASFRAVPDTTDGYLSEAAPLGLAEAATGQGDPRRAAGILDRLTGESLTAPEEVFLRLGAAYEAAGDLDRAVPAYRRVYYDFPLSSQANAAQSALERLQTPAALPADHFRQELMRAERLFDAGRWAQARPAYEALARAARGGDAELIAIRLGQCDYHLGRHRAAIDALRPHLREGSRPAEARFYHLSATRALGDRSGYVALARGLVSDHPQSRWAEETLNNLASHYITIDEEAAADGVFRDIARRYPGGRYADRAAWRIGWRAYKLGRLAEAAGTFEAAAAAFPRADYRPSWLYWAARSRERLGEVTAAHALYRIAASDYLNSYYGRLASARLADRRQPPVQTIVATEQPAAAPAPVPTDSLIRALIAAELYDAALSEVEYARRVWGDSTPLQATVAGIRHRRGFQAAAADRFGDVRGAITLMRRAYPQFMAAGGEDLPPDILAVIFPLDYWPLIRKYSDAHRLDPYLMAALIAQESTFTPDVRSSANAVGLMQLLPSTGRRYAARLGIPFSERALTHPETNIRLGMRYFKDLLERFGGEHYALASYNAGENRVSRWIAERRGFAQDEFIDDIPFPETQNYVKRILGTADDYRRLYGGGILSATPAGR